jgi:hypothetical protein
MIAGGMTGRGGGVLFLGFECFADTFGDGDADAEARMLSLGVDRDDGESWIATVDGDCDPLEEETPGT